MRRGFEVRLDPNADTACGGRPEAPPQRTHEGWTVAALPLTGRGIPSRVNDGGGQAGGSLGRGGGNRGAGPEGRGGPREYIASHLSVCTAPLVGKL
jgi:hypothetical protein